MSDPPDRREDAVNVVRALRAAGHIAYFAGGCVRDELLGQLDRYVTEHRQRVIAAVETWWDKYRVTLGEIEAKDADVNRRLDEMLRGLGYE